MIARKTALGGEYEGKLRVVMEGAGDLKRWIDHSEYSAGVD